MCFFAAIFNTFFSVELLWQVECNITEYQQSDLCCGQQASCRFPWDLWDIGMTEPIFHFHYFNSLFFSFLINSLPFIINYQYLICTILFLLSHWYFKPIVLLSTKTFRWHRNGNKMSLLQYLAEWSYLCTVQCTL